MYEELVKRLKNLAELFVKNGESYVYVSAEAAEATREIAQEAANALEEINRNLDFAVRAEAAAVKACTPRWIPVTEKLPESGQWVIYHTTEGAVEFGKYKPEFSVFTQGEIFAWIRRDAVTHWMPLPEPPKEET